MTETSSPPQPQVATTAAEYVGRLRALRAWAGLTYRQVERRAESAGHSLPHSTLASALGRDKLPREDLVVAFVRACGCDEEQTAAWVETRRRLAASAETVPEQGPQPDPEPEPVVVDPEVTDTGPAGETAHPVPRSETPRETTVGAPVIAVPAEPRPVRSPWRRPPSIRGLTALVLVFSLGVATGWWLKDPASGPGGNGSGPVAVTSPPERIVASPEKPAAWWRFDDRDPSSERPEAGTSALRLDDGVRRESRSGVDAIVLDGVGRVLTAEPVVNTAESFSLTVWARLDRVSDWSIVASQHDGPFDVFLLGHNREVDRWGFMTPSEEDGWLSGQALSASAPERGVWTHLAGVYDAGTRRLRLYVNGQLVGTSRTHALRRAKGGLELGGAMQHGRPVDAWHGAVDDVRVYRGVLSATAVTQVMKARA
ncbi:LamG-like jellyroll fold domain-containing protein [Thermomonospora umbrina]|uniref:LamG-like jellyroll fold domain-containing protein n=1 Tax=Thermomonospora umbrina TaxID=111806 RepID=UPI001477040D|nr:LamG-like jellyroll fold domain-containing protein [Thermomonospora umbrina]